MPIKIILSFALVENFRRALLEVVCDVCVVKMCNKGIQETLWQTGSTLYGCTILNLSPS
jgi:hypothetical protein